MNHDFHRSPGVCIQTDKVHVRIGFEYKPPMWTKSLGFVFNPEGFVWGATCVSGFQTVNNIQVGVCTKTLLDAYGTLRFTFVWGEGLSGGSKTSGVYKRVKGLYTLEQGFICARKPQNTLYINLLFLQCTDTLKYRRIIVTNKWRSRQFHESTVLQENNSHKQVDGSTVPRIYGSTGE